MGQDLGPKMRELIEKELIVRAGAELATKSAHKPSASMSNVPDGALLRDLVGIVAEVTKFHPEEIDTAEDATSYGSDSIIVTEIMSRISRFLGETIPPTAFFEAKNLDQLALLLAERYGPALARKYETKPVDSSQGEPSVQSVESRMRVALAKRRRLRGGNAEWVEFRRAGSEPPGCDADVSGEIAPGDLAKQRTQPMEVAIIGLAGRYPGARNIYEFWENLRTGRDCVTEVPLDRWESSLHEGRTGRWGGFLEEFDRFDPLFFNIAPREAVTMDPQERIFLECAYETMEDAGYVRDLQKGLNVGVFCGVLYQEYSLWAAQETLERGLWPQGFGSASVANRVSYVFNFHGPSMAIDTMCAASLTAIDIACQNLRLGTCEMALAGGVNLSIHPFKYLGLEHGGYASKRGRCQSFGEGGDGYVPGDGVGAVLLKPLERARADGDRIYGVIRASASNHGGRSGGYSVPNPNAQSELIATTLGKAGIDPRAVSYIEAHGTGTELGDPIEIAGLTNAFRKMTTAKGFCAIGSVKSNIGHAESAAGIAGVTKVLLQLKHRQLAPSLHSRVLNSRIDFPETPFVVQRELAPWNRPVLTINGVHGEVPRVAGVSSFGAGGANAHLIIEEYEEPDRVPRDGEPAAAILLSARTADQLRGRVERLLGFLQAGRAGDASLGDIAYTLQIGREAMDERLGFVAPSRRALETRLAEFLSGVEEGFFRGRVRKGKKGRSALMEAITDEVTERWVRESRLDLLLEAWVDGFAFDWRRLYADLRPRKVGLPTYPFARERYVIPVMEKGTFVPGRYAPAEAHPAKRAVSAATFSNERNSAETNTRSPLQLRRHDIGAVIRFEVEFTGDEFFLADHVINGERVLPGVVYLELARAAFAEARPGAGNIRVSAVVWLRPLVVGGSPSRIAVVLEKEAGERFVFRIEGGDRRDRSVYCQGRIDRTESRFPDRQDISGVGEKCCSGLISGDECYAIFRRMGIDYGPGHRGIEELRLGDGLVLARLCDRNLPVGEAGAFALPPGLMDSAFQSALGLFLAGKGQTERAAVPFALGEVEIFGSCLPKMWAVLEFAGGSSVSSPVQKIGINLCDDEGKVLVRMRDFSCRVMDNRPIVPEGVKGHSTVAPTLSGRSGEPPLLMLRPEWTEKAVSASGREPVPDKFVILCDYPEVDTAARVLRLDSSGDIAERFESHALSILEELKGIAASSRQTRRLIQVVVPNKGEEMLFLGLSGLLRSAQLENRHLVCQILALDPDAAGAAAAECLETNGLHTGDTEIRYDRAGRRMIRALRELDPILEEAPRWRDGGRYLVTGGAGGLGLIVAEEISVRVPNAVVILSGRSPLSAARREQLDRISRKGCRIEYRRFDVTDRRAVHAAVLEIERDFGSLNGVVHSAGLLRDNFIFRKTSDEARTVLGPKVAGLVHLDEATAESPLDLFVLFSSVSGAFGNLGQADYAAGNAFMDAFAEYRNSLVASARRRGRTVSINWPLWREGGMGVDPAVEKMMTEATGMIAMTTHAGLRAFRAALSGDFDRVIVMQGDAAKMRSVFVSDPYPPEMPAAGRAPAAATENDLRPVLARIVSQILNIAEPQIDFDGEFSEYGFDSITFTEFANALNRRLGTAIAPTIFFEYQTLESLAEHLAGRTGAAGKTEGTIAHKTDALSPATGAVAHDLRPIVAGIVSRILGIAEAQIDFDGEFSEYGFDSITFTELASALNGRLGTELAPTAFFEFRTISDLADHLAAKGHGTGEKTKGRLSSSAGHDHASVPFAHGGLPPDAIAVIGMSARFPMAADVEEYWRNLAEGRDCISEVPGERWDWSRYYGDPAREDNRTNIKWAGVVDGAEDFDPAFFGISPREAEVMDPHQRLLMMYVWKAIEDAGYAPRSLWGSRSGIFVGTVGGGYSHLVEHSGLPVTGYTATGLVPSVGPNRMSYYLNIHGPSEPIETACSSSLVAVHRAVCAIERGDCEAAIAGGVNVLVSPEVQVSFTKAGMLSPDGRCRTFSRHANGYVRGEGVGMLFLKRFDRALADGDRVLGIIRGSAENHGGRSTSLTAPNPRAQADLLREAYSRAEVDPATVGYIEAHGTGTALGDPIEINGLKVAFEEMSRVFGRAAAPGQCAIGSVKSNIGHLEIAAGAAGLIKVLLQMKHRTLAPTLHCREVNPYIDLRGTPFRIAAEKSAWPALRDSDGSELPRRAGVSSFGFGGVNAHVVLEEYIAPPVSARDEDAVLVVLSARTEERLRAYARDLQLALDRSESDLLLRDVAFTLQTGRDAMEERLAFVASSKRDAAEKLARFVDGNEHELHRGCVERPREETAASDLSSIGGSVSEAALHEAAVTWTKGGTVAWMRFYSAPRPRRVSLPTYPFARERYWISDTTRTRSGDSPRKPASVVRPEQITDSLKRKALDYFRQSLSEHLGIPMARLETTTPFERLGLDSVMVLDVTTRLETRFGTLPKTIFFEYQNLDELSDYFVREHAPRLQDLLGDEHAMASVAPRPVAEVRSRPEKSSSALDVAIIGLAGRYPGARNLREFWRNLAEGRNTVTEIPKTRWDSDRYFDPGRDHPGRTYGRWGGFLDGVDEFDSLFFHISPAEAEKIDPQERLFLQCAYEAMEDAGYAVRRREGLAAGVYVGVMYNEYAYFGIEEAARGNPVDFGASTAAIANRVSHALNLAGPSIGLDTMCSSSLTAIHLACQEIRAGGCELAIAGGVNLSIHPNKFLVLGSLRFLSSDGRCASFGEDGDGYVPAEGVGAIVLKSLERAVTDGDRIYGVIKGTSINHGGRSTGFTVPNPRAQASVIARAMEQGGVDPSTISYIEAHGTGTSLGDPIEIAGLTKAFGSAGARCAIGSVKSNIGHAESAAGIAGVTKVLLQLMHGKLAPSLHSERLNGKIDWERTPFRVQRSLAEWARPRRLVDGREREFPRVAGVSSFGAGGSNAHVIIEEYRAPERPMVAASERLAFVLSARNAERLGEQARLILSAVESGDISDKNLVNAAYTLQTGREPMEHRLAIVAGSVDELGAGLRTFLEGGRSDRVWTGRTDSGRDILGALADDDDLDGVVEGWIAKRQFARLLPLWVSGLEMDWTRFHVTPFPVRISLPTYPFARERYWIPRTENATAAVIRADESRPFAEITVPEASIREPAAPAIDPGSFLREALAEELRIAPDEIDPAKEFIHYGVDSVSFVRVGNRVMERFGVQLSPTIFFERPTIRELTEHLKSEMNPVGQHSAGPSIVRFEADAIEPSLSHGPERVQRRFSLSEGQLGLWANQMIAPEMSAYNYPVAIRIEGEVDAAALRRACEFAFDRHPMLRAVIRADDGIPYQALLASREGIFRHETTGTLENDELMAFVANAARERFDLERGPLMRVRLYSLSEREHVLLVTVHHTVTDGLSTVILCRDLLGAWLAYASGREPEREQDEATYFDFVEWERGFMSSDAGRAQLEYWRQRLAGDWPKINLPADRPHLTVEQFRGESFALELGDEFGRRVAECCRNLRTSPSAFFLAVLEILLSRYTGDEEVVVGVSTMGRSEKRFERTMGYFVNTLLMRNAVPGAARVVDLINDVRTALLDGLENGAWPYSSLVRELEIGRDRAPAKAFSAYFTYQNFLRPDAFAAFENASLRMSWMPEVRQEGDGDFGVEVYENGDGYLLNIGFDPTLFDRSTIARMAGHYVTLLEQCVDDPERTVQDLSLLTPEERREILEVYVNRETTAHGQAPRVDVAAHVLFEIQATRTPDAPALLVTGKRDEFMTYGELNIAANRLAHHLLASKLSAGDMIGVCLERSSSSIAGILAVWKAGGVYVPIDPSDPPDRIGHILSDSRAAYLMVDNASETRCRRALPSGVRVVNIEEDCAAIEQRRGENPGVIVAPSRPAYAIYTSGSTGHPKGVLVAHEAFAEHAQVMRDYYGLVSQDRVLQFSPHAFDASLEQILSAMAAGATVVMRGRSAWSTFDFLREIAVHRVSVADLPPSFLGEVMVEWENGAPPPPDIRLVIVGGETLSPELARRWSRSPMGSVRLVNAYGPTEAVITCLAYEVRGQCEKKARDDGSPASVPIGRPLGARTAYILDRHGRPVPPGVPGELVVGGACLARGYIGQPELTAEKFEVNPFAVDLCHAETRLYRTGDRARFIPGSGGLIEFLGREDDQVKIRGHRVELGEIESRLADLPGVREVVVVPVVASSGGSALAAFVATNERNTATIRKLFAERLPSYMMPGAIHILDALPRTAAGKIARNRLAVQAARLVESNLDDPFEVRAVDEELARIWTKLLGRAPRSPRDNFFDLGGDSILVIRLLSEVSRALGVELRITDILREPTLEALDGLIRERSSDASRLAEATTVVPLQGGSSGSPLFLVHPVGGDVYAYVPLARKIGGGRPIYGLRAPALDGGALPESLEEMAATYVKALRRIQKAGPYSLAGWSLGGVVAYEMARILSNAGEAIESLVLIESYHPEHVRQIESTIESRGVFDPDTRIIAGFARDLLGLEPESFERFLRKSFGDREALFERLADYARGTGILPASATASDLKRRFEVFRSNIRAMDRYRPGRFAGSIIVVCAEQRAGDASRGWVDLVDGSIEIIRIPGNHYSVVEEPAVSALAERLSSRVEQPRVEDDFGKCAPEPRVIH